MLEWRHHSAEDAWEGGCVCPSLLKQNRAGHASHGSATRPALFLISSERKSLPLPFYHIYPQWLHLKLLPILPDASPKKDTDIARSSASIFFRSVLPQVGQRGALACSADARSRATLSCSCIIFVCSIAAFISLSLGSNIYFSISSSCWRICCIRFSYTEASNALLPLTRRWNISFSICSFSSLYRIVLFIKTLSDAFNSFLQNGHV